MTWFSIFICLEVRARNSIQYIYLLWVLEHQYPYLKQRESIWEIKQGVNISYFMLQSGSSWDEVCFWEFITLWWWWWWCWWDEEVLVSLREVEVVLVVLKEEVDLVLLYWISFCGVLLLILLLLVLLLLLLLILLLLLLVSDWWRELPFALSINLFIKDIPVFFFF